MSTTRSNGHAGRIDTIRSANDRKEGVDFARRAAHFRAVIQSAVSDDDIYSITRAMVEKAQQGDTAAAKLVLAYAIGRPPTAPEPDGAATEQALAGLAAQQPGPAANRDYSEEIAQLDRLAGEDPGDEGEEDEGQSPAWRVLIQELRALPAEQRRVAAAVLRDQLAAPSEPPC